MLTPLELINRIAQLVPPPRTHRHRYYGVLAPNSPLRGAVTAMAQAAWVVTPEVGSPVTGDAQRMQARPSQSPNRAHHRITCGPR